MISAALSRIRARVRRGASVPDPRQSGAGYASDAARIRARGRFSVEDIELIARTISEHDIVQGSPWDDLREANLELPDWFRPGLDPDSEEYARQQHALWRLLSGRERDYSPDLDEMEAPLGLVDAVRRPGYYLRRDREAVRLAADQIIATGMILKHSGVHPGDRVLEYGAGFGQTALALARLGVAVDTVDISRAFCEYVTAQAQFFEVPLSAFQGHFGCNPRVDARYNLILFYESFHHCAEFRRVIRQIKHHLAPGGRVLLVGEPILRSPGRYLPYPWGLRLDAEPVAQVRRFGWLELGFTEEYLLRLFTDAGFLARRIDCEPSVLGTGYIFEPRTDTLELAQLWFPDDVEAGWNNPEGHGRWTRAHARVPLDTSDTFRVLEIDAQNHHPVAQTVAFEYGDTRVTVRFRSGERRTVRLDATRKAPELSMRTRTIVPAKRLILRAPDRRSLGILVRSIRYCP